MLMTYQEFAVLYKAQLSIGKLLSELTEIKYTDHEFIQSLQNKADKIAVILGGGYFEDSYWLNSPLDTISAHTIYQRQLAK